MAAVFARRWARRAGEGEDGARHPGVALDPRERDGLLLVRLDAEAQRLVMRRRGGVVNGRGNHHFRSWAGEVVQTDRSGAASAN